MYNFENLNDVWNHIRKCKSIEAIQEIIKEIPNKFGIFSCEQISSDYIRVTNTYYDSYLDEDQFEEEDIYIKDKDNVFYCLIAIEYKNYAITDNTWTLGESDNYEELYELFIKLQCQSEKEFFSKFPKDVYQIQVQLEECKEEGDEIECIEVKNQFWINKSKI